MTRCKWENTARHGRSWPVSSLPGCDRSYSRWRTGRRHGPGWRYSRNPRYGNRNTCSVYSCSLRCDRPHSRSRLPHAPLPVHNSRRGPENPPVASRSPLYGKGYNRSITRGSYGTDYCSVRNPIDDSLHSRSACWKSFRLHGRHHSSFPPPYVRLSMEKIHCGRNRQESNLLGYDSRHRWSVIDAGRDPGLKPYHIPQRGNRYRCSACSCNRRCDRPHNRSQSTHAPLPVHNSRRGPENPPAASPLPCCGTSHSPSVMTRPRDSDSHCRRSYPDGNPHRCSAYCCSFRPYGRRCSHLKRECVPR